MNANQLLRAMSTKLHLPYQDQDWGIINADAARLQEFIVFYEAEPLEATQRFQLAELILASANERLVAGASESDSEMRALISFVRRHREEQRLRLEYWSDLDSDREDEFPLGPLLRALEKDPQAS